MQSGKAGTRGWVLDYEPEAPREVEPLMGWTASADMNQQLRLRFATRDEAVAYAQRHGIPFRVLDPHRPKAQRRAYSDNFRFDRKEMWTH
jgi:hypothetical protein